MTDIKTYSKLLRVLGAYSIKFPNSKITKIFESSLSKGVKVLPVEIEKEKLLEKILDGNKSIPGKVQLILNSKLLNL